MDGKMKINRLILGVLFLLCGFVLGNRLKHVQTVSAQTITQIHIKELTGLSLAFGTDISGSRVTGFSCVDQRLKNDSSPDVHCYIAYVQ